MRHALPYTSAMFVDLARQRYLILCHFLMCIWQSFLFIAHSQAFVSHFHPNPINFAIDKEHLDLKNFIGLAFCNKPKLHSGIPCL